MGMYTDCKLNFKIKPDSKTLEILSWMIKSKSNYEVPSVELPNHDLFNCWRLQWMLRGGSGHFVSEEPKITQIDSEYLELSCCFSIKNYEQEIEKFLDWISQYCSEENEKQIGYIQREGFEKHPVFFIDKKIQIDENNYFLEKEEFNLKGIVPVEKYEEVYQKYWERNYP